MEISRHDMCPQSARIATCLLPGLCNYQRALHESTLCYSADETSVMWLMTSLRVLFVNPATINITDTDRSL